MKKRTTAVLLCTIFALTGCSTLQSPVSMAQTPQSETETVLENAVQPVTPDEADQYRWFYYYQLSDPEKDLYNRLMEGIESDAPEVSTDGLDENSVSKVWLALNFDNPQYFWLEGLQTMRQDGEVVSVVLPERTEEIRDQESAVQASVQAVLNESGQSQDPYQNLKSLFENIVLSCEYDEQADWLSDVRSVLLNHRSVCGGYAKALQLLCQQAGIPCIYVTGLDARGGNHAWNQVLLAGEPYWVDATWADTTMQSRQTSDSIAWQYLCSDDTRFLKDHTVKPGLFYEDMDFSDSFSIPSCTAQDLNYFRQAGCYIVHGAEEEVLNQAQQALDLQLQDPQTARFDFMFETPEDLELVSQFFLDQQQLFLQIAQARPETERLKIQFAKDENNMVLTVFADPA